MEDEAKPSGCSILICDSVADPSIEQHVMNTLLARRVDGVLLASVDPYFSPHKLTRKKVPLVFFDRLPAGCRGQGVLVNNFEGALELTRHLIDLGHRRIGTITGPLAITTAAERLEGFRNAMGTAGLPVKEGYVQCGNFRLEGGYRSTLEMMKLNSRPTALFAANYEMTLGAFRATRELGIKCPESISIVGFDDMVMGSDGFSWSTMFSPQPTTLRQPSHEIGKEAVRFLMREINKSDTERENGIENVVRLRVELHVRESSGPPPTD